MKSKILISLILISFLLPTFCFAQEPGQEEIEKTSILKAEAGEERNVVVGQQVSFSAVSSLVANLSEVEYLWDFGDNFWAKGKEVSHVYNNAGVYKVELKVTAKDGEEIYASSDQTVVNVDKKMIILISDSNVSDENLKTVEQIASNQGILVVNFKASDNIDYLAEKELAQRILKSKEDIRQADSIVIWTENNLGLNALLNVAQDLSKLSQENGSNLSNFGFSNKYFVVVTDQNFTATSKLSQSVFNLLNPQFIVLTRQESTSNIFYSQSFNDLLNRLKYGQTEYRLVGLHTQREAGRLSWLNMGSFFIGYMVDRGVPLNTLYLILILPVIATIMAFSRQIIGFKALGIYTPSIVAVSFLVTGLKYGLALFVMTLFVGTIGRLIARKIKLSYLPRMAIVLTLVSFSILVAFFLGAHFNKTGLLEISIFPILVLVLLTEKFISVQIERGSKVAVMMVLETLFLSIVCFWLASWQVVKTIIIGYPELILLTIILNLLIGRWTGLRLIEYYRFRKVIKNVELPEKK